MNRMSVRFYNRDGALVWEWSEAVSVREGEGYAVRFDNVRAITYEAEDGELLAGMFIPIEGYPGQQSVRGKQPESGK
jgi:hypothetical protein